jgi:hypothetical protein
MNSLPTPQVTKLVARQKLDMRPDGNTVAITTPADNPFIMKRPVEIHTQASGGMAPPVHGSKTLMSSQKAPRADTGWMPIGAETGFTAAASQEVNSSSGLPTAFYSGSNKICKALLGDAAQRLKAKQAKAFSVGKKQELLACAKLNGGRIDLWAIHWPDGSKNLIGCAPQGMKDVWAGKQSAMTSTQAKAVLWATIQKIYGNKATGLQGMGDGVLDTLATVASQGLDVTQQALAAKQQAAQAEADAAAARSSVSNALAPMAAQSKISVPLLIVGGLALATVAFLMLRKNSTLKPA